MNRVLFFIKLLIVYQSPLNCFFFVIILHFSFISLKIYWCRRFRILCCLDLTCWIYNVKNNVRILFLNLFFFAFFHYYFFFNVMLTSRSALFSYLVVLNTYLFISCARIIYSDSWFNACSVCVYMYDSIDWLIGTKTLSYGNAGFFFIDSHLDSLQCDVYIVPFSSCYFYFDYMIQEFKDAKLGVTVTKRDTFSTHIDHSNPLCEATIHLFDWNCIRNGQSWMHNESWVLCKFWLFDSIHHMHPHTR